MKSKKVGEAMEEFFYRLESHKEFWDVILYIRKTFNIPVKGFTEGKERVLWYKKQKGSEGFTFIKSQQYVAQVFHIPVAHWLALEDYIFYGKLGKLFMLHKTVPKEVAVLLPEVAVADILPPSHTLNTDEPDMESFYKDMGEPYAKLIIFGNGSKNDVIEFIRKNWNKAETIIEKQRGYKRRRLRQTPQKDRNRIIKDLGKKSTVSLQQECDSKSTSRDILISKILRQKGFPNVSEGYIRKILTK